MLEHNDGAEIPADQLSSVNITVPWWIETGVAVALGAILAIASNANATALCDDATKATCPAACAHPRPVVGATFIGRSLGLSDFILAGKTSKVLCFRYEGSTDTATVAYDTIFHGAFEP